MTQKLFKFQPFHKQQFYPRKSKDFFLEMFAYFLFFCCLKMRKNTNIKKIKECLNEGESDEELKKDEGKK